MNALLILIYLLISAGGMYFCRGTEPANVIVNASILLIAGVILLFAVFRAFLPLERLVQALREAAEEIEKNRGKDTALLLPAYLERFTGKESLFSDPELEERFEKYLDEIRRLSAASEVPYKCDIEDYINYDIINARVHRNTLNLVSGTMTGLGILGTFLGLSLGLQSFNTGTSEEIAASIPALMNSIKVAFYTSIYGIIFALVFNVIYRRKLENAFAAMDEFLDAFRRHVSPSAANESLGLLLAYEKKQSETADILGDNIAEKIAAAFAPQYDKLSDSIVSFSEIASRKQLEGVEALVDKFLEKMDRALGHSFARLSDSIRQTCEFQEKSAKYIKETMDQIGTVSSNIQQVNELSERTIARMSDYVEKIEQLQGVLNENFSNVNLQLEANASRTARQQEYVNALVEYERGVSEAATRMSQDLSKQTSLLSLTQNEISSSAREQIDQLAVAALQSNNQISAEAQQRLREILDLSDTAAVSMKDAAKELGEASHSLNLRIDDHVSRVYDAFDRSIGASIERLNDAVEKVDRSTQQAPAVISDVYANMEKTLKEMQQQMQSFVHTIMLLTQDGEMKIRQLQMVQVAQRAAQPAASVTAKSAQAAPKTAQAAVRTAAAKPSAAPSALAALSAAARSGTAASSAIAATSGPATQSGTAASAAAQSPKQHVHSEDDHAS